MTRIEEIVNYMIQVGTQNTTEGNWIFYDLELAERGFEDKEFYDIHEDEILETLMNAEEIADVKCFMEGRFKAFDLTFYTDYCPNMKEEER